MLFQVPSQQTTRRFRLGTVSPSVLWTQGTMFAAMMASKEIENRERSSRASSSAAPLTAPAFYFPISAHTPMREDQVVSAQNAACIH